eukprot:m.146102 g.146102  ORF g.146102 m.146102 type:complete len:756 (-) comp17759_c0_seq2:78-2345(-)
METFFVNINVSHRASVSPSVSDDVEVVSECQMAALEGNKVRVPKQSIAAVSSSPPPTAVLNNDQSQRRRKLPSKPSKGPATKRLPKPPSNVPNSKAVQASSSISRSTALQRGRSTGSINTQTSASRLEPRHHSSGNSSHEIPAHPSSPIQQRKPDHKTVSITPRRATRKSSNASAMTPSRSARLPAPPKSSKAQSGVSIVDLSTDIWQHIAQFVVPRDLANVAATSTKMRMIMHSITPTLNAHWRTTSIVLPSTKVAKEEVSGILKAWPHLKFSYECRTATSGTFFSASEKKFVQQSMVPQFSGLHKLTLTECDDFTDVSPLAGVHTMCLNRCNGLVDISPLKNIQTLSLEWCLNILDVSALNNVIDLTIDRCPKVSDLSGLAGGKLQRLTIRKCRNIRSVAGLAHARELTHLTLEQMHNVSDLAPIARVQVLTLDECPSVRDITVVTESVSQVFLRNCRNIRTPANFTALPNVCVDAPRGPGTDGEDDKTLRSRSNSRMMLSNIPATSTSSLPNALSRAESMWSLSSRSSETSMNPEDEFDHVALQSLATIGTGRASIEPDGTPPRCAKYRMSPLSLSNSSGTSSPSSCHGNEDALGARGSSVRVRSDAEDWVQEARALQEATSRDRMLLEQQFNEQRDAIEQQQRLEAYEREIQLREERELAEAEARWHFEEVHIRGADRRRCDSKKREEQRIKAKQAIENKLQQEAAMTREKLLKSKQKVDENRMQRKERIKSLMSRVKSREGSTQRASPVS